MREDGRADQLWGSLTIDHGWQEVAQTALDFVRRFVPAKPS